VARVPTFQFAPNDLDPRGLAAQAQGIRVVAMIAGKVWVAIDFVGFTVGDVFVVGYGTDYAEKYRHLPYIGAVE
jgi:hypoxanthine-guanine phosphoribosyltransferase